MAAAAREVPASTERYEALRRQALGAPERSAAALGLAVLVYRGVAAWLELATSVDEGPGGGAGAAGRDEPMLARGGLVGCVAQMLLGRRTA